MTNTAKVNTINKGKEMKWFKNTENIYMVMFLAFVIVAFSGAVAQSQTSDTLWHEDFEENAWDRWYVTAGSWEIGVPTSGPDTAHSGAQCAATVLSGNYADGQDTYLIRIQSFVVPTHPNPRLRFWHWYRFNNGDYGQVLIKAVEDSIWQTLEKGIYGCYDNTGGWHSSLKWTRPLVDLSDYSGQTVEFAFRFRSVRVDHWEPDVSNGWYIDEVLIETGDFIFSNPENWEIGIGDWYADYGVWEIGQPTSGPGQAYSGLNCAGTILDGNYYDNLISHLISPAFNVPGADNNPRLRFWHWYSFNNGDSGQVLIKVVEDSVWQTLENGYYSGNSNGIWAPPYFPLDEYGNETVQFAFRFRSVRVDHWEPDVSSGWYIDSISVQADDLGIITGNVHHQGDPVEDVYVRVVGTDRNAITDTTGLFTLSLIEPGTCDVSFSHPDYRDTTLGGIIVDANETTQLGIIELEPRTGIDDDPIGAPVEFMLNQNYPNPFNPSTTIKYNLPKTSEVTIEIYDILGRKVETLVQGQQPSGYNQVTWNADDKSSGLYFYRIQAGEHAETKKMLLLK